jgi:Flp pilus assembly protein TadG
MKWSNNIAKIGKRRGLLKNQHGVAAIEFALAAPMLISMLLGISELSRFILVHAKAEKVAFTMSDLVSQTEQESLTNAEITQMMDAASEVMNPFTFGAEGVVIITSVGRTGTNQPTVRWQRSGGGTFSSSSQIGSVNANASLPAGFTMADKENVIVAEVYYRFTPIFGAQILGTQTIYKTAYFKPRLGALTAAPT